MPSTGLETACAGARRLRPRRPSPSAARASRFGRQRAGGSVAVTILMLIVSTTCMTGASTMLLSLLPLRFHAMGRMATVTGLLNASAYVGSALASTGFGALSENGGWTAVLTAWLAISAAGMALCFFSRGGGADGPPRRPSIPRMRLVKERCL